MLKSSKNISRSKTKFKGLSKPFKPTLLNKAQSVVSGYHLVIEENEELGYLGSSVEIPTVSVSAKTLAKCYAATQEALKITVATMFECGKTPPQAFSAKKRNVQINIRINGEEKLLLTSASKRLGFKGLSDFIRTIAIERIQTIG
jgi:predicted RNase H-like HicB family nuclease